MYQSPMHEHHALTMENARLAEESARLLAALRRINELLEGEEVVAGKAFELARIYQALADAGNEVRQ